MIKVSITSLKGGRKNNEDNYAFGGRRTPECIEDVHYVREFKHKKSFFAAVADGMGGLSDGEAASCKVVTYFMSHKKLLKKNPNLFFRRINKKIVKYGGGTTFSAVISNKNNLEFYTIGDSPIFYYDYKQDLLTQVNYLDNRASELNEEVTDPFMYERAKSQLLAFLGCKRFINEEVVPFHYYTLQSKPGDIILLCTDGAASSLSSSEIKSICRNRGQNYPSLAEAITQAAVCNETQRGIKAADNATCVCIEFIG